MAENNIYFLSIDASTSCTGLSVLSMNSDNKFTVHYKTSCISKNIKNAPSFSKIADMYSMFSYVMSDLILKNYNISFAVFEDYSFGSPGRISMLAELCGLFKHFLFLQKIPFDRIPPARVKLLVAGHGKASKDDLAKSLHKYVSNIEEIKFNNYDESDSVAIGIAYSILMMEHINESSKSAR